MAEHLWRWKKGSKELQAFGKTISVVCDVRNEVNGRRHADQVVYSIPDKKPYQPRQFPKGKWQVTGVHKREDPYLEPFFIATDASQELPVWSLKDGNYNKPTEEKVMDTGYGLHHSVSQTTLGCIKIVNRDDLLWLVDELNRTFGLGEKVYLEVYV